jgi:type III restriction enzyme
LLKLDWTDLQLSRWLDKECRQADITQPVLLEFCRKIVAHLTTTRGLAFNELLRFKFQLAKAVQQKISFYRQQAFAANYQNFLFGSEASVTTSFSSGFAFDNRSYPAAWFYSGAMQFKKHFFGSIGELKQSGEEFECAKLLEAAPQVKFWIRNLAQHPDTSFWLQTSTDRFYPDFVAMLQDGRIFVVEYKGEPYVTNDDSREKTNVGELWASKSNGQGLFLMAQLQDAAGRSLYEQIASVIA